MLEIKYRNRNELTRLANNPRTIDDKDFASLCESIRNNPEYFEARAIILSDRTGELVIIAGNQRDAAAEHLGLEQVPTILMSGLSEEQEREIVIRDNVSNGKWDFDVLGEEWATLPLEEWGVPNDWQMMTVNEDLEIADKSSSPKKSFKIQVFCRDEAHRDEVYMQLLSYGYDVRMNK